MTIHYLRFELADRLTAGVNLLRSRLAQWRRNHPLETKWFVEGKGWTYVDIRFWRLRLVTPYIDDPTLHLEWGDGYRDLQVYRSIARFKRRSDDWTVRQRAGREMQRRFGVIDCRAQYGFPLGLLADCFRGGKVFVDGHEVKEAWYVDTEKGIVRTYNVFGDRKPHQAIHGRWSPEDFPGREVECPAYGVMSETLRGKVELFVP